MKRIYTAEQKARWEAISKERKRAKLAAMTPEEKRAYMDDKNKRQRISDAKYKEARLEYHRRYSRAKATRKRGLTPEQEADLKEVQFFAKRQQQRAWGKLHLRIKQGLIIKPTACQKCGNTPEKPIHAHHHFGYDAENALNVQWLCEPCHQLVHKNEAFGKRTFFPNNLLD